MTIRMFGIALLASLFLGGCQGRMLLTVKDGPSGGSRTTVLSTLDTVNYIIMGTAKIVYWECGETADGLSCKKTCDLKDDEGDMLLCNRLPPTRGL